jgi:ABC-type glycerol-3-phosphate transport system substrate-binding protein
VSEPVIITFACYRFEMPTYRTAAEAFHEANPDIEVQIVSIDKIIPHSFETKTDSSQTVHQLASTADTFLWGEEAVETGPKGFLLDLASFLEESKDIDETFLPGLFERFRWKGGVWGLPAGFEPYVVFYDERAFEVANLEPPSLKWKWEELLSKAKVLAIEEGEEITRYGFADVPGSSLLSVIFARGRVLVDDSVNPPVPLLDAPDVAEAVQWYANLALTHEVMPSPVELGRFAPPDLSGRAAMWVGLPRLLLGLQGPFSQAGRDIRIVPLPERSPIMVKGYFISAGTYHPREAWRWLKFLSSHAVPPDMLPARKELVSDSSWAKKLDEEKVLAILCALENAIPPIRPIIVGEALYQALEKVFMGEKAELALATARKEAMSKIARDLEERSEPIIVATPQPKRKAETYITFFCSAPWEYEPLAEAFREYRPDIEVEIVEQKPGEILIGVDTAEVIEMVKADCYEEIWIPWSLTPEKSQSMLDLRPLIEADPTFPLDDYYPPALKSLSYEGRLLGIPAWWVTTFLSYNPSPFDKAGLSYPNQGWKWEDFFTAAKAISRGKEGGEKLWGFAADSGDLLYLLEAISGGLVDNLSSARSFRFTAPQVIKAAQMLAELEQAGAIVNRELLGGQKGTSWRDSRIGMWLTFGAPSAELARMVGYESAPVPKGKRCVLESIIHAYYINANTPHPEACWEWIKFLSERFVGIGIPARRSLVESEAFREKKGKRAQALYLEAWECEGSNISRGLEGLPGSREAYHFLRKALEEIVWEGADVHQALAEAQRKADTYVDCLRRSDDPEAAAEACFKEVGGE